MIYMLYYQGNIQTEIDLKCIPCKTRSQTELAIDISVDNLCMSITTNPANGEMFSIQYCVIKFVSDLRQDGIFS
jgi:hypothetical protein